MSFLPESFFEYLKERSLVKKILDGFLVATIFTWVATVYMIATNYNSIQQFLKPPEIDMKALVKLDQSVNVELGHMMQTNNADRAALARFHDTIKDVQGSHFAFETRTNETVQPGVSTATGLRQNLLVSMIAPWAQQFIQGKCVYTTDLKPTDLYFEFYKQIGVKSDIKCPVNNLNGLLIGFVYVEYTTKTVTFADLKKIEPQVRLSADKIGAILTINNSEGKGGG